MCWKARSFIGRSASRNGTRGSLSARQSLSSSIIARTRCLYSPQTEIQRSELNPLLAALMSLTVRVSPSTTAELPVRFFVRATERKECHTADYYVLTTEGVEISTPIYLSDFIGGRCRNEPYDPLIKSKRAHDIPCTMDLHDE